MTPSPEGASVDALASEVRTTLAAGADVALCCDRTAGCVLAATGIAYLAHAEVTRVRLVAMDAAQPRLGEHVVRVAGNGEDVVALARRVLSGFCSGCGRTCARRVVIACSSDATDMPEVVHRYLRLGFREGGTLLGDLASPEALALDALVRRVSSECEHTRQFVRFTRLPDGTFLSAFEPNQNTLPLVGRHFADRMREDRFAIVDARHLVALLHEPGARSCVLVGLDRGTAASLAERLDEADEAERYVHALWRTFYRAVGLPGRGPEERGYDLRASWMPKRFWHALPELDPTLDGIA